MSEPINPFTTEWTDIKPVSYNDLLKGKATLAESVKGYSVELNGNQYRYAKAEPLCDIERNRFDLLNKNNK